MWINLKKKACSRKSIFLSLGLFVLSVNFSCQNPTIKQQAVVNIKLDTLKIPITPEEAPYYGASSIQGDDYIGYNFYTESIDVFSLKDKKLKYKIKQPIGEGPDEIRELHNLFSFGKDSLVLIASESFVFRTTDSIFKRSNFESNTEGIWTSNTPRFQIMDLYSRGENEDYILLNGMAYNFDSSNDPKSFYKNTFPFLKYYLKNDSLAPFNIRYPVEYINNDYSFRDYSSAVISNDSMYFNFSAVPKIYVKKINDSVISEIPIPTDQINSYINPVQFSNASREYHSSMPSFGKLHKVNDFLICIYKSGSLDMPDKPWEDPKIKNFALIFKDGEFITSVEIFKAGSVFMRSFDYKNGILIPIGAQDSEDYLNFLHLTID